MLKPWKTTPSHEDLFIQRHEWLFNWALQMTDRNREQAEDLLHDAFIHFTQARPDLDSIQNLEGYLYVMLKNMHLSHVRRLARIQKRTLSIVDYNSAEAGLRTADPHAQIQARDELRAVCSYACVRKEKSKAGSVLILRFFHGYYPSEISQILQSPRRAVDDWLRIARREAKVYLESPNRLAFLEKATDASPETGVAIRTDDLLTELRRAIFSSRHGDCSSNQQIDETYRSAEPSSLDCAMLAHIVSCAVCLEYVNTLLGLAGLSDRFPTDKIGKNGPDSLSKGGPSGARPGANAASALISSFRRHARDVFEHSPEELFISVNGFILGSQSLGSELNEQTLTVNIPEKIGFVEIFSEQELRLLFLNVEPPPDGPVEHSAYVELSDGRTLEVNLNFGSPWPQLHAVYCDPALKPLKPMLEAPLREARSGAQANLLTLLEPHQEPAVLSPVSADLTEDRAVGKGVPPAPLRPRFEQWFVGLGSWLNPRTITAALAIVLILALLLVPRPGRMALAADLLSRSASSEESLSVKPDLVTHRTVVFEDRVLADGASRTRKRIEVWSNAAKHSLARRVYDEKNRIVAAEWTSNDGARLIYRREAPHQFDRSAAPSADTLLAFNNVWQMELSARDFSEVIGDVHQASVTEKADTYLISYQNKSQDLSRRLRSATLTLSKADLHPLEERLVVLEDGREREYSFVEQGFERISVNKVAPAVFEVDPELVGRGAKPPAITGVEKLEGSQPAPAALAPLSAAAFAELKLTALYQLHQIGSCVRERANLTGSPESGLHVEAIVETEKRKAEVQEALGSLINTPSVRVDVNTVAEAMRQQQALPPGPLVVRRIEVSRDRVPAYPELRRYFSEQIERELPAGEKAAASTRVDEEVRRFANRILGLSRQALLQAWALKHHHQEIASMDYGGLSPQAQARWRAIINEHANSLQQGIRKIRLELQPVLFAGFPETAGDESDAGSASDMSNTIERLFDLASSDEEAIRAAFAVSTENPVALKIKTEQFWRSLENLERLARRIQSARD